MRRWIINRSKRQLQDEVESPQQEFEQDQQQGQVQVQQVPQPARQPPPAPIISKQQQQWNSLKYLQSPTEKTKAELQEIINKHQAAALLEANDTIRALEEQREEHKLLLGEQQRQIERLQKELNDLKGGGGDSSISTNSTSTASESDQIRELKRQLQERDALIAQLQLQQTQPHSQNNLQNQNNNHHHHYDSDEEHDPKIQALQATIQFLTHENTQQKEEIQKLHNIINEIQDFQQINSAIGASTSSDGDEEKEHYMNGGLLTSIQEEGNSREEDEDDEDDQHTQTHKGHHKEEDDSSSSASSVLENEHEIVTPLNNDESSSSLSPMAATTSYNNNMTPPPPMTLNGNQLLLLFTSMPHNRITAAQQSRLETILQALGILSGDNLIQVLDGCDSDPASINLRNDLFRISGLQAVYPQLFLVNFAQNDIKFVGDFDTLVEYHDTQTLASIIGLTPLLTTATATTTTTTTE